MDNQFVNYSMSLNLTDLGFDQDCLATIDQTGYIHINGTKKQPRGSMMYDTVNCPLYQQAFDWFREKSIYSYITEVYEDEKNKHYVFHYHWVSDKIGALIGESSYTFSLYNLTYQEAREKALEKLIEICSKQS